MSTLRLYRPTRLVEIIHRTKIVNFEYAIHSSSRVKRYALIVTWYNSEEDRILGHKFMTCIHFYKTMGELTADNAKIVNRIYDT